MEFGFSIGDIVNAGAVVIGVAVILELVFRFLARWERIHHRPHDAEEAPRRRRWDSWVRRTRDPEEPEDRHDDSEGSSQ